MDIETEIECRPKEERMHKEPWITCFRCENCLGNVFSPLEEEMPSDGAIWLEKAGGDRLADPVWHFLCDQCVYMLKTYSNECQRMFTDTYFRMSTVRTYNTLHTQFRLLHDDWSFVIESDFGPLALYSRIHDSEYPMS